jgi:predicted MFS family arabinose efflux permease
MSIAVDSPRYKWYLVAFLFCTAALNYADRTAINAVFPLLKKDLGMSDVALGAIGSFFLWSYALLSPFAGYVGDRVSRRSLIFGSLVAWSVVTLVTGLASTSHQLLAMRVLLGIAECVYLPAAIALIADYHSAQTKATAMAIHVSGLYVGMIAGGALAGYLGDLHGWRSPFFILGGVGLALGLSGRLLQHFRAGRPSGHREPGQGILPLHLENCPQFIAYSLLSCSGGGSHADCHRRLDFYQLAPAVFSRDFPYEPRPSRILWPLCDPERSFCGHPGRRCPVRSPGSTQCKVSNAVAIDLLFCGSSSSLEFPFSEKL